MVEKSRITPAQWIDALAKKELPAITSMAGTLEGFSNDDVSSIPKLSKTILHDQSLSSCLLRVANSSYRAPVSKITTVSRAATVLGIQAVKNICMTAKILDGLLKNNSLPKEVYERLMMLMADAFFAGLLARNMVPHYDEKTQEEVYLAAMLYHIGETSFWSTGAPITRRLIKKANMSPEQFESYCEASLGVKFSDLSIGLAKTWGLGDLLVKALDDPEGRTVEIKMISKSNQLAKAISRPPASQTKFDNLLKDISKLMKTDIEGLKKCIEETRKEAHDLLISYGAEKLQRYIKPLPQKHEFGVEPETEVEQERTTEVEMFQAFKQLTQLTRTSKDINEFLTVTLQNCAKLLEFDFCSFWVMTRDRHKLQARTTFDIESNRYSFKRVFSLVDSLNLMAYAIQEEKALLVNDYKAKAWREYITEDVQTWLNNSSVAIAPVKVGTKVIGLVTAQCVDNQIISEQQYSNFCDLTDHLNMCLNLVSNR